MASFLLTNLLFLAMFLINYLWDKNNTFHAKVITGFFRTRYPLGNKLNPLATENV
jgi:hypothetical protein